MTEQWLTGRRVLLVEDEYFIVEDLARQLEVRGAEIAGPVANVADALRVIAETDRLDAAVLDVNLQGELAYPVADALMERGVPFIFATGYDDTLVPPQYAHIARCQKPIEPDKIAKALLA